MLQRDMQDLIRNLIDQLIDTGANPPAISLNFFYRWPIRRLISRRLADRWVNSKFERLASLAINLLHHPSLTAMALAVWEVWAAALMAAMEVNLSNLELTHRSTLSLHLLSG